MADYIRRDIVLQIINTVQETGGFAGYADYCTVFDEIDAMPAADVQPVDRWISCKDKMPEDGQDVITLSEGRILNHAVYDAEKAVFRYKILIINPTHWIPLPPLPEAIRHDETCTVVK